MNKSESSLLQTSLRNFEMSAKRLNLDEAIRKKVSGPKEKIEISINPTLRDGQVYNIKAFVVRHNDILGPAKGGIRMTSTF